MGGASRPTGGKPNAPGEVGILVLPNSRLSVTYSKRMWRLIHGADPPAVEPDVAVAVSSSDFLAGRDPVLEAALTYSPSARE